MLSNFFGKGVWYEVVMGGVHGVRGKEGHGLKCRKVVAELISLIPNIES